MTDWTGEKAVAWIHSRLKFGSRPGLERIEALAARLADPQNKIKTIHIAGTNGKGSTVTYLRNMLMEAGVTVGTYTSPYITKFNERVQIDGEPISDEELAQYTAKIYPHVMALDADQALQGATEFEILTALMYDYFFEKKVDVAIIEVGLGGLLDCTNIICPVVAVITSIGYDHMDILGSSLEDIAFHKAGIIKSGSLAVLGKLPEKISDFIREEKAGLQIVFREYGKDYEAQYKHPSEDWGEEFDFVSADYGKVKNIITPLLGKYQTENAATAIQIFQEYMTVQKLKWNEKMIRNGIFAACWPGRLERLCQEPLILLDGAHNVPAIERLVETLQTEFQGREIYVLFAAIGTKDITRMLEKLKQVPHLHLYLTTFDYPTAVSLERLAAMQISDAVIVPHWQEGIAEILPELSAEDLLLVTGSLYFIAEVRKALLLEEETNE